MEWFAVHVIEYVKLRKGHQDTFPVIENVLLIEAASPEEARQEATRIGKESYETLVADEQLLLDDQPAVRLFGGIRKIITCEDTTGADFARGDAPFRPGHGTEITFSRFYVDSEEQVRALVQGESVDVWYEE